MKSPVPAQTRKVPQNSIAQPDAVRLARGNTAFVDNRPEAVAQRKRQEMMNNSPQVLRQKAIQENINNTPKMVTQRMQHNVLRGDAAQRVENEAQPGAEGAAQLQMAPALRSNNLEQAADTMNAKTLQRSAQQDNPSGQNAPLQLTGAAAVIQRLTGYEVETNIPVYSADNDIGGNLSDKGNNEITDPIKNFLAGGLMYDGHYGEHPDGRYTISSDHNNLQTPHGNIIRNLMLAGFLKEGWKHRALANIEYITPARDELAKGGRLEHRADITAVKSHLATTAGLAAQDNRAAVPAPARQIYTGIPKSALIHWITANGADRSIIESDLDLLLSLINNQAYVQETSGTLPSDIPALYTEASIKLGEGSPNQVLSKIMVDLLTNAVALGTAIFQALTSPPVAFGTHKAAVTGYISLIASYVLADYVSMTNVLPEKSTEKNLLPFLSKTPLHETMAALPADVLPGISSEHQRIWNEIRTLLIDQCKPYDEMYVMNKFEVFPHPENYSGAVFPLGINDTLEKIFASQDGSVSAAPGKPLGLDEPDTGVHAASGQKSIPLEDRFFGQKYNTPVDTTNIEARLDTRFGQATDLQLGHIPEALDQRTEHATKTTTVLDLTEQRAALAAHIKKNIAKVIELNQNLISETITDAALDATDWNAELQSAQVAEEPEKGERLSALANEVHLALEAQMQLGMHHALKNTDEDHPLSFAGARKGLLTELNKKYDQYVKFKPKWYKPETLKNVGDTETAAALMIEVGTADADYVKQRQLFLAMTKDTDHQARADQLAQVKASYKLFCTRYEALFRAFGTYEKNK